MYYNATFREYYLAQQGYHKERELDQHYLRRAAYIVHCSMVSKPLSPDTLWPIGEVEAPEKDEDFVARMLRKTEEAKRLLN